MLRHIFITLIFIATVFPAHAEPWLCGTPLLITDTSYSLQHQHTRTAPAAPAAPVQLGQIDQFFIHIPKMEVQATCVAIGKHIYIYVENSVQLLFTQVDATAIAAEFDQRIYPKVREWMGTEARPGIDRDNRITVLMHDVGMNQSARDYGGYFAPEDQLPTARNSNQREMLFMDIYQFRERDRHTFYSSLAHEFAHLVNWHQNGGTIDQRWLEEGTASFIEWAVYGTVHNIFVDGYLESPDVPLPYANTSDVYYGGSFMLLLYLYEQYGGVPIIRAIIEQDTLGQQAIDNALKLHSTNDRFVDVFLKWGLTNWFNSPTHSKQLGYQHLPNRKVTAPIQRISNYPNSAGNIPIANWGAHYFLFQNLPQSLDITLVGETVDVDGAHLYATTLALKPNMPSNIRRIQFNAQNSGRIRFEGLPRSSQILLMVTADTPQMLRYSAAPQISGAQNFEPQPAITRHPIPSQTTPKTVTYAYGNRTQQSLKKSNISYVLEPMTQLHLASDYQDILIYPTETGEPYLYATSDWGLEIFSLTQPTQPRRIGEIATPGKAQAVVVDADTAYVADGANGVQLISLHPPTAPKIVKTLGGFIDARKVQISDGNVYVLDSERGLLVFNQHDTENIGTPRPRRFFKTAGTPINVAIKDNTVYISDLAQGLHILDPSPFGNFVTRSITPVFVHDFKVDAFYGYIAGGNLRILNIANPQQPRILSHLNTPGIATGIQLHNQTVYLTDQHAGLQIIDVRDAQQPRRISSQPTSGNANDVARWNDFTYIADGKGGIQTIDTRIPHAPIWMNRYASSGIAYGLDVVQAQQRTAHIAIGAGGIKTVEFTTPYEGIVTRTLLIPATAATIRVRNGLGYVAADNGMFIVDILENKILSYIPTANPVTDIALVDGYAYLCTGTLTVVDIRVPQQSRLVSQHTARGSAYRITLNAENQAYVAALEGGMHIFDTTRPPTPQHIATYTTQGNAIGVSVAPERAYLLDSRVGVIVLDVTEPRKLKQINQYATNALPIQAQIQGEHLYLLDKESLQVVDTRTLTAISQFNQLRFPYEFKLIENTLYVADLYQLRIFQVHPHRFALSVEFTEETSIDTEIDWQDRTYNKINHLGQNFPNPFNPETWIPYQLATAAHVTLSIYDAQGRRVHLEIISNQRPGAHTAYWDGRNTIGEPVASGVYFYSIEAGGYSATRKMFIQR